MKHVKTPPVLKVLDPFCQGRIDPKHADSHIAGRWRHWTYFGFLNLRKPPPPSPPQTAAPTIWTARDIAQSPSFAPAPQAPLRRRAAPLFGAPGFAGIRPQRHFLSTCSPNRQAPRQRKLRAAAGCWPCATWHIKPKGSVSGWMKVQRQVSQISKAS